jgi:hypothetical protein
MRVRACLSIWLERPHGTQTEDDRGPLTVFNTSMGLHNILFGGRFLQPITFFGLKVSAQTFLARNNVTNYAV